MFLIKFDDDLEDFYTSSPSLYGKHTLLCYATVHVRLKTRPAFSPTLSIPHFHEQLEALGEQKLRSELTSELPFFAVKMAGHKSHSR